MVELNILKTSHGFVDESDANILWLTRLNFGFLAYARRRKTNLCKTFYNVDCTLFNNTHLGPL